MNNPIISSLTTPIPTITNQQRPIIMKQIMKRKRIITNEKVDIIRKEKRTPIKVENSTTRVYLSSLLLVKGLPEGSWILKVNGFHQQRRIWQGFSAKRAQIHALLSVFHQRGLPPELSIFYDEPPPELYIFCSSCFLLPESGDGTSIFQNDVFPFTKSDDTSASQIR